MSSKISLKRFTIISLVVLAIGFLAVWKFDSISEANDASAVLVPNLIVNKSVVPSTDLGGNGNTIVNPGDTLGYTVTIQNMGMDATGVMFSDTLSTLTSLSGTANVSPLARPDTYDTVGNTQLQVDNTMPQSISPAIFVNGNVLTNDVDPDGAMPTATAITNGATTLGGLVTLQTNGTFVYTPPAGTTGSADSFTYTAVDANGATGTGTVTVNLIGRVRYVKNNAAAGDGRSNTPFNTLAGGQSATAGDTIYVFQGNGTTSGQNAGITLQTNQRLIGAGVALTMPGITVNGVSNPQILAAGAQPQITNTAGNGVSVGTSTGVEIQGLNIGGSVNAIDATFSSTAAGSLTIANNTISSAGAEGIDINGGSTGTISLFITSNTVTATGNGIDINRTAGTVYVSSFSGNTISGNTGGIGINVVGTGATILFDANSGTTAYETVSGGNTVIGTAGAGNGVGGAGIVLNNVKGDISFNDLDIFADGGTALLINGTTPNFNAGGGTGLRVTASTNTPVLSASSGSAADITDVNINLVLNTLTSSITTAIKGVSLLRTSGTFTAPSGSINSTNALGTGFFIDGGSNGGANVNVTYGGTITADIGRLVQIQNVTAVSTDIFSGAITDNDDGDGGETGVSLTGNSGATITFSGGLKIKATSNAAFTATGGGTINATQNNTSIVNTLTTTTGTALNVVNTSIGASGLTFRSITSNASGTGNGITLDSTGASGFLTVTGTGAAGTGGTIQSKNGADGSSATQGSCIYLNNTRSISLAWMDIQGCQNYGIRGITVNDFSIANSTVGTTAKHGTSVSADGEAVTLTGGEGSLRFTNLTGTATFNNDTFDNGFSRTVFIHNSTAGSTLNLTVSNSTLRQSLNNGNGGDPGGNSTDAMYLQGISTATMNLTVTNCQFTAYRQFAILTDARDVATMNIEVGNSNFSNSNTGNANASVSLNFAGAGAPGNDVYVKYYVHDNTFRHGSGAVTPTNGGAHIVSGGVSGGVKVDGRIINNTIGVSGVVSSGAGNAADAMRLFASGNNTATTRISGVNHTRYLVQNNTIQRYGEVGIQFNARQGNSRMDATVLGNTIREPGTAALGAFAAIWVNSGALPPDTNQVNIAIGNATVAAEKNTMTNSDPSNATDVFLDKNTCGGCGSTLNLYRNGSTAGGAGEALVRQILVDDNNPTLDLLGGFTNGSTIGVVAGLPPQPAARPAVKESEIKTGDSLDNNQSFSIPAYQSPSEMLTSIEPLFKNYGGADTISNNVIIATNEAIRNGETISTEQTAEEIVSATIVETNAGVVNTSYLTSAAVFVGDASSLISELVGKLDSIIAPTVYAQKSKLRQSERLAPEAGETITKGPFTLLAGETVTIKFNATVNTGPFAAGVNNITNTATISGSNFSNVTSNQTSILLDAAPDLSVTASDGATTTQPGGIVTYTLTYANTSAANNLQDATGIVLTETVPANTTFNAAGSLPDVWSCADGSAAGTTCTLSIGAVNANAPSGMRKFAVKVLDALPVTALKVSDTATIADDGTNGTDLNTTNNTSTDTDDIVGVWLGATSDWNTNTNWSNNILPPNGNNVSIPSGATTAPTVINPDVTVNNLVLNGKDANINANRTLNVTGAVTLGSNNVGGAGTLSLGAASTISRTTGQVNAALDKAFSVNGAFTYPVGTATGYSPVLVNITNLATNPSNLRIKANDGTATAVPALVDATTLDRFWSLTETGDLTADVTFNYLQADVDGTESNYGTIRVVGTTATSLANGTPCPGAGNPCVAPDANTIFVGGLSAFSDWTAGELVVPTAAAATIDGRITDERGRGLRKVTVRLIGGSLIEPKYALTDWLGNYHFEDVPVGETYVITPISNRYQFAPATRVHSLTDNIAGVDFVGSRQSP